MADGWDIATSLGTCGAAIAAAWAAWQAARSAKQTAALVAIERERRDAEDLEQRSARLTVDVEREMRESQTGWDRVDTFVVIRNEGRAPARNVQFASDDETGALIAADQFPIARLGPGSPVRIITAPSLQDPLVFDVRLQWDDDAGTHAASYSVSLL